MYYAAVLGPAIPGIAVLPIAAAIRPSTATTLSVFGSSVVLRGLCNPLPSCPLALFPSCSFTLLLLARSASKIFWVFGARVGAMGLRLETLHSPPFLVCLKGFKAPILGDFNLRTPQNWGAGGRFGQRFVPVKTTSQARNRGSAKDWGR